MEPILHKKRMRIPSRKYNNDSFLTSFPNKKRETDKKQKTKKENDRKEVNTQIIVDIEDKTYINSKKAISPKYKKNEKKKNMKHDIILPENNEQLNDKKKKNTQIIADIGDNINASELLKKKECPPKKQKNKKMGYMKQNTSFSENRALYIEKNKNAQILADIDDKIYNNTKKEVPPNEMKEKKIKNVKHDISLLENSAQFNQKKKKDSQSISDIGDNTITSQLLKKKECRPKNKINEKNIYIKKNTSLSESRAQFIEKKKNELSIADIEDKTNKSPVLEQKKKQSNNKSKKGRHVNQDTSLLENNEQFILNKIHTTAANPHAAEIHTKRTKNKKNKKKKSKL
ncbi:unnamed protein product, partial [Meganyctiphanes norvegica]